MLSFLTTGLFEHAKQRANEPLRTLLNELATLVEQQQFDFKQIAAAKRFETFATSVLLYLCIPDLVSKRTHVIAYLTKAQVYSLLKHLNLEPETHYTTLLQAAQLACVQASQERRITQTLKPIELLNDLLAYFTKVLQDFDANEIIRHSAAQKFQILCSLLTHNIIDSAPEAIRYPLCTRLKICYDSIPDDWVEKENCCNFLKNNKIDLWDSASKSFTETINRFAVLTLL